MLVNLPQRLTSLALRRLFKRSVISCRSVLRIMSALNLVLFPNTP